MYEHIRRRSNQRQNTDQGKRTNSVVPLDQVEYFEASGNYVRVHEGEAHYRVREKLSTMEKCSPERDFVRIHRSVIVNRNRIHGATLFSGKYLVPLVSGKQVALSRSHRQQLSALKEPY